MNDPSYVRLVDPHTEGYGGAYHLHTVVDEIFLCLVACRRSQSGMINGGLHSVTKECIANFLRIVTTHAIDDSAFIGTFEDKLQDGANLFLLLITSANVQAQVRTVKRRNECFRILHIQLSHNVLSSDFVGRSGQCHDGCLRELLADGLQLGVLRTEIVSPLRDTMRFVNGKERDLDFLHQEVHFHEQSLGGYVK